MHFATLHTHIPRFLDNGIKRYRLMYIHVYIAKQKIILKITKLVGYHSRLLSMVA